ncbi:uncharacterized protein LOC113344006 [Papaver somniferum]|uniref:uncharacterized protein LOC113344006 n=1 Tax=Papaver somniferum TaxID=3469 RepID=UPI000E6F6D01|nr:uncharacterized protein LOC113344006 [Papaver somniferum]
MTKLNNFIARHELFDLPLNGATFTWTNNQFNSIRSRIDIFFISAEWELYFPRVMQQALPRPCSDHNPIDLFCDGVKTGPGPFRCSASFSICKKLQLLKQILRTWSKQEYGDLERRMEELEDTFVTLDAEENMNNGLSEEQWDSRFQARQEYCKLAVIKAGKWRAGARVNHIQQNDDNTKYFHRLASDRRRMSYIGAITVNGEMTTVEAEIKDGIVQHFQNIFQNQSNRTVTMDFMNFKGISDEQKIWLESEVTEVECLAAMKKLGQNKAPGHDGFPIQFLCTLLGYYEE